MCEIKTVLVSVCLILLKGASFCINRVFPGKKVGQHSEINKENPCENENKDYCLNGECYYVLEEGIVGYNCSWLYGGKRCQKVYVVDLRETLKVNQFFTKSYAF